MKKIAVMQPYLFPYLGYFQLANHVDEFWIYDCVQYIRRGWMNRNYVQGGSENRRLFTISVNKGHREDRINNKFLADPFEEDFVKLIRLVESEYRLFEFKDVAVSLIEDVASFASGNRDFVDVTMYSLEKLFNILAIDTNISRTSTLPIGKHERGQERIVSVCEEVGAECYINPAGGRSLYDNNLFASKMIRLGFMHANSLSYLERDNFSRCFLPLSILDFLARIPPEDYPLFLESAKIEF
ncbi:WbqC family protein [Larsenimonas rhizosphaerae]|uniref:WbqC family protein n=1 Tax=Larsenimonas rhizosphaerae TaxID=2944682 RepID=UPI0020341A7D|nr:WbqC family protein [Larsenimonas rhizosphaerae]MCM2131853.1 WbqC family protein [Larsenimonas rhizosphaerae]